MAIVQAVGFTAVVTLLADTILDFRTLEALGIARDSVRYTVGLWSEYVAYCRRLVTQATGSGVIWPRGSHRAGCPFLFHGRYAPWYGYLLGPVTTLAKMGLTQS